MKNLSPDVPVFAEVSEHMGLDHSNVMQVDTEAYAGTSEQVECHPGGADDKAFIVGSFHCAQVTNYAGTL